MASPPLPDEQNVPAELRERRQWVLWEYQERNGKRTKVPIDPSTRNGADSTDPLTWGAFEVVLRIAAKKPGYGVAYMFAADDPFTGVDLDHCIDAESRALTTWAGHWVERLLAAGAYVEISPSGAGVKAIIRAKKPGTFCRTSKFPEPVEIYEEKRQFTVTGRVCAGCCPEQPIGEGQEVIDALYAEVFAGKLKQERERHERPAITALPLELDDTALLDIGRKFRGGSGQFSALYDRGDTSHYNGDESGADLALMNHLAFLTRRDAGQMERLFSASALGQRSKWRERPDYRERTIECAIRDCRDVFTSTNRTRSAGGAKSEHVQLAAPEVRALSLRQPEDIFADLKKSGDQERVPLIREMVAATASDGLTAEFWAGEVARAKFVSKRAFLKAVAALHQPNPGESGEGEDDDPGLVKLLADEILSGTHFARDAGGRLWIYEASTYHCDGESVVRRRVKRLLNDWDRTKSWSSHRANEVCEYIRVDSPELWEKPPLDRVNLMNGILDIATGELGPHSPGFLSPVQLPARFDPAATCPAWERFIQTTFPEDAWEVPFEVLAWLMTPDTSIQKAILATGEGSNGKSVWLAAMQAFLGLGNVVNLSLQRLSEDRFAVARLVGKLANICSDIPSTHLADTSMFKAITGGDRIPAECKFRDGFDFVPYSRLIFSANHPPRSADASKAFFRRWIVIPFTHVFDPENERPIPRAELDAQLADPNELSGVLNRALALLPRVQRLGISEPASMLAALDEFQQRTDPVAVWLDHHTVADAGALVTKQELHLAYGRECNSVGRPYPSKNAFGRTLKKHRPNIVEAQRTVMGKLAEVWLGIGLATRTVDAAQASSGTPRRAGPSGNSGDSAYLVPDQTHAGEEGLRSFIKSPAEGVERSSRTSKAKTPELPELADARWPTAPAPPDEDFMDYNTFISAYDDDGPKHWQ